VGLVTDEDAHIGAAPILEAEFGFGDAVLVDAHELDGATQGVDVMGGGAADIEGVTGDNLDVQDFRPGAGVEVASFEGFQNGAGGQLLTFDHHPPHQAITGVGVEVGVIGGAGEDALATGEHEVEHVGTFGGIGIVTDTGVEDFDGVNVTEGEKIGFGHGVPLGVGGDDKSTGLERALCQFKAGFAGLSGGKIEGEAEGDEMPTVVEFHAVGVEFRADEGGEVGGAEGGGIGYGPVVLGLEVVGDGHEVVAGSLIHVIDSLRRPLAIGIGGMGVEVAAPEFTGFGKDSLHGGFGCA